MNQGKMANFEYIVATDLAARGIGIEVSHVCDAIHKTYPSLFTIGRTGQMAFLVAILYQPSDDSDIRELENSGSDLS